MQSKEQFRNLIFRTISRAATAALVMATMFVLTVVLTQSAQAQGFKVIHTFTGGGDGAESYGPLTVDQAGNFYGTTSAGSRGNGTVFRLSKEGANWLFSPLYAFHGSDGSDSWSAPIMGPDGNLYGTTHLGGPGNAGVAYSLIPAAPLCDTALCPWTETVLYSFTGGADGANPGAAT